MRFNKIQSLLSIPRIDRYYIAVGNSKPKAVKLYKANLKIAQAFHPILGVLEVVLRNKINTVLTTHFADPDWIINQKRGFMIDPSLRYRDRRTRKVVVNDYLKSSVEKSEQRLRKLRIPVTTGKVIADQSLGFWTDLFEVHHYRLLSGRPIQIFTHMPSGHGRRDVINRLNKIRQFRNRINHNEPICFNGSNIDFTYAQDVYNSIIEILTWLDTDIIKWIADIDTVNSKIVIARKI
ncbi:hypothetical protein [Sphingobacterium spiritivorum]